MTRRAQLQRAKLDELGRLLSDGGMDVTVVDDAWPAVWRKVVTNAAVNPLTALIRETNAELLADARVPGSGRDRARSRESRLRRACGSVRTRR